MLRLVWSEDPAAAPPTAYELAREAKLALQAEMAQEKDPDRLGQLRVAHGLLLSARRMLR